jgi:cytoskeletal protein RodZ
MITVGEVLKKQRKDLGKTVEQVALDTKIQPRFITYIESNDFTKFDSPIYAQGFIKIYAKYLELNEDRILAIYRRSVPNDNQKNLSSRETRNVKQRKIKISPKFIAIALSILFLLGILGYIGFQIYQFQNPPTITILSPDNEESVTEKEISVIGSVDTNSSLFINDQPVEIGTEGNFNHTVTLNPGVNIITILAKKNNSTQESVETVKVTYEAPEREEENEEPLEEQVNTVRLEIVNSSVWVQFNVDQVNKLSQIVQTGEEYEYEVENQFSLTTGISTSTKLYFNDEEISLTQGGSSVGSITCKIVNNNQINCE